MMNDMHLKVNDVVEIEYLVQIDLLMFANSYRNQVVVVVVEALVKVKMYDQKFD
jgi:hypothetical protein